MQPERDDASELVSLVSGKGIENFAEDVRRGLEGKQKSIPCRYLYDAAGCALYEKICELPEYYLTRTERALLERHADEIASALPARAAVAELGSGNAEKTRVLLRAILRRQRACDYVPIDISALVLRSLVEEMPRELPGLRVTAIHGRYGEALRWWTARHGGPLCLLFLGSSIGNFTPEQAADFLISLRGELDPEDGFLLGVALKADPALLQAAYQDPAGVTEQFIKNVLLRVNRELQGRFEPDNFDYRVVYDPQSGRVEMSLVSQIDQCVPIHVLGLEVGLAAGESIHVEDSWKYSEADVEALARKAGFFLRERWKDQRDRFVLSLLCGR